MTTPTPTPLELVGQFTISISLFALSFVARAWAISTLWNWFVAAPFNAPHLTLLMAVGVSMVVNIFTANLGKKIDQAKVTKTWRERITTTMGVIAAYPAFVATGWVVHHFIS